MPNESELISFSQRLAQHVTTRAQRIRKKIAQAALGSIPWIGGVFSTYAAFKDGEEQYKVDSIQREWLEEHAHKFEELSRTLGEVLTRIEKFGASVEARLESEEYLAIVRRGFKAWDDASTQEKRRHIVQLITNAGISQLCSDDVIRLFQQWITDYHEIHFAVIAAVYSRSGITRQAIWQLVRGTTPREDSAEADLFKLLIRDLSTGGILRQHREKNYHGEYIKKSVKQAPSKVMKSAFDGEESYELTELGRQFVHYTMEELVPRLGEADDQDRR